MSLLKINDNSSISVKGLEAVSQVCNGIANKTLDQLQQEGIFVFPELLEESADLSKGQMILQRINNAYHTGNVMGFIGYEKERLVIQSRFSSKSHDYFLTYLLGKIFDLPNIVELETDAQEDTPLFNLLLFLFPTYLKEALRKGIYKSYIRNEYNDCHVKGIIDIARHIKSNTPFLGKVAYNLREHSYDNNLTELIRHTIEFIRKKKYGKLILVKIKEEVQQIINATQHYNFRDRENIIVWNQKHVVRHAFFHEYRALQHLCLMILQQQKHQIGEGPKQIHGILFDGAWLWEEYINSLLENHFYHPRNKTKAGEKHHAQQLFSYAFGNTKRQTGLIYPDFISKTTDMPVIADAKYKPLDNIGNRDYLQLLAYMLRFDAKMGFYLYPHPEAKTDSPTPGESPAGNEDSSNLYQDNKTERRLSLNQGSTFTQVTSRREDKDITLVELGLTIPQNATCFQNFAEKIHKAETYFQQCLDGYVNHIQIP